MSTFQVFRGLLMGASASQDVVAAFPDDISGRFTECTVYVVFGAGTGAGSVVVETSHDATYAGTWANLATVNWAAANKVHYASITGCYLATRVRIATAVTGGTVSVYLVATN